MYLWVQWVPLLSFTQWPKVPFCVTDMANNFITKEPTFVSPLTRF